jgi:cbb3-type cytochrome oxidase subunit 1
MEEKEEGFIHLPRWFFVAACVVLGVLVLLAGLNLSLNFLDSRSRARYDATLEERAHRLEAIERRLDTLEAKR